MTTKPTYTSVSNPSSSSSPAVSARTNFGFNSSSLIPSQLSNTQRFVIPSSDSNSSFKSSTDIPFSTANNSSNLTFSNGSTTITRNNPHESFSNINIVNTNLISRNNNTNNVHTQTNFTSNNIQTKENSFNSTLHIQENNLASAPVYEFNTNKPLSFQQPTFNQKSTLSFSNSQPNNLKSFPTSSQNSLSTTNSRRRSNSIGLGNVSPGCLPQGPPQNIPLLSRKFVARRISEGETGRLKEELKCQACGKGYKHITSLAKHLWEHTPEWSMTSKLLISKHQQVQLLEAASILVSINEPDETENSDLPGTPKKDDVISSASSSSPSWPSSVANTSNAIAQNAVPASATSIAYTSPAQSQRINTRPSTNQVRGADLTKFQTQNLAAHRRNERLGYDSYLHQTVSHNQSASDSISSSLPSSKSSSPPTFHSHGDQSNLLESKSLTPSTSFETDSNPARSPCSLTNDNGSTPSPSSQPSTPQLGHLLGTGATGVQPVGSSINNSAGKALAHSRSFSFSSSHTDNIPHDKYKMESSAIPLNSTTSPPASSSFVSFNHPSCITDSLYPSSSINLLHNHGNSAGASTSTTSTRKKRSGPKTDPANLSTAFQHEYQRATRNRRYSSSAVTSAVRRVIRTSLNNTNPILGSNNKNNSGEPFVTNGNTSTSTTGQSFSYSSLSSSLPNPQSVIPRNVKPSSSLNRTGVSSPSNKTPIPSFNIHRVRRPSALDPPNKVSTRPTLDSFSPKPFRRYSNINSSSKEEIRCYNSHKEEDSSMDLDTVVIDEDDEGLEEEDLMTQKAINDDQAIFGEMD